ncbi:protein FAR1-RELATED SEQUENCE 6-like, partial [Glycine soja]|uniref:protein FAR1-RELATED SEQUENCE 6-like n=1 Tax=Glycine soja TaxID=3848 RepID=UPI0010396FAC
PWTQKSTLRLMRILEPSLASLTQSSWSLLSNALGGVGGVFECRENVLRWARSGVHENGFVAVILRSDTNTGSRGRSTFVLIGCERSGEYKCRKKEFIRRDTRTRKCGCPFKLRCKPVAGGEGKMVKLICGVHNHELAKSLVGHPYTGRLTKVEKTLIADMTKSMVKPRNILLTLKEHNANSCTTIKQIYNARSAFRSSIRGSDLEMQHLMKLIERDQYIYWHRIKDEDVVRDIFWCHPDSVKLVNACNLVILIDITYKTNRYRLPLLDFVGMTPTGMTFFAGFAYVEGERVNNLVWALQRFRGLFLKRDALSGVIGSLTDCPSEQQFDECLKKVESAHSSLKRLLQNSIGDLCSVWDVVNNMITLQHTQIKASFETSTHVIGHVFTKPYIGGYLEWFQGDGNYGYRSVAGLLGMGQDSWSVVRNHLLKELANFSEDYIKLFGGTERFEELRM